MNEFLGDRWIIVIEPRPNYRASIKQFLSGLKLKQVKVCATVSEARTELIMVKAGLFIVEWGLPQINGLQFCRELRKDRKHDGAPFLLLSVENLKADVVLASEVGVDAYLLKPFSFEDFRDQLVTLVSDWEVPGQLTRMLLEAEEAFADGEIEKARELYYRAHIQYPQSARALCGLGAIAERKNSRDEALKHYQEAISINSEYIDAFRAILSLYELERDTHGILSYAQKLHLLCPDNQRYTLLLAKNFMQLRDLKRSEEFFRKTARLSPTIAEAYRGLGTVYMLQEDYDKARLNFHKALDLDGRDVSTLNSLGLIYVKQGKFKEGINMYRIALRLDPTDCRVLFNLGHAYERKGDLDHARETYNEALLHDPEYEKARRGLQRIGTTGKKVS